MMSGIKTYRGAGLMEAMALANLCTLAGPVPTAALPASKPRTTKRNPQQQREAFEAAEAKRQQRQARNLRNLKQSEGDLL